MSSSTSNADDNGDGEEEDEFVEQEGCPNEEDFNKWSHHCSPNTCDDEALKKALNDDTTVSFIFGLEVNWSLLQEKLAVEMEAEERRKEQQRLDLLELNAKRARERQKKIGHVSENNDESNSGSESDEDMEVVAEEKECSGAKKTKKRMLGEVVIAESKGETEHSDGRRKSMKAEATRSKRSLDQDSGGKVASGKVSQSSAKPRVVDSEDEEDDFEDSIDLKAKKIMDIVSSDDEESEIEEGKAPLPPSSQVLPLPLSTLTCPSS